jgi:hypothetical protein
MKEGYSPEKKEGWLELYKKLNIVTLLVFLSAGLPVFAAIDLAQLVLIDIYQRKRKEQK